MSSYTALSALSLDEAPELPEDKAREQQDKPEQVPMELPRGAHTGNVVHDLLENNVFIDLAKRKDISVQRDKACQRYGLKLEHPEMIDALLYAVVATPLSDKDADFCLMNLPEKTVFERNAVLFIDAAYGCESNQSCFAGYTGFSALNQQTDVRLSDRFYRPYL
jgi:ATP-dependent exoDNAse (exonuclease V) beta subunit